jgi:hypothetical protein
MLSWIIQISIISVIFIFLVHHLITFFKSALTVPKIKDLVNLPNQKYQNIYDTIGKQISNHTNSLSYTAIDLLPTSVTTIDSLEQNSMKNELKSFLKKQLNTNDSYKPNTVVGLDSYSSFM